MIRKRSYISNFNAVYSLKDAINVLKFSSCGRYLASAGVDASIFMWDISSNILVAYLGSAHSNSIYSLEFSRDNTVFASGKQYRYYPSNHYNKYIKIIIKNKGGLDNTIKLWNMSKLTKDIEQTEDLSKFTARNESQLQIGSWRTKQTPIIQLHFTRRNVLVGVGPFRSQTDNK